jgi:Flp pilus assembly protein TadG
MRALEDDRTRPVSPGGLGIVALANRKGAGAALGQRFLRDEQGHVAVTFGLMIIPCMMMVGLAVDWGRMLHSQAQLQGIVDNIALAAGREVQKATSNYTTVASSTATTFWNAHKNQVKIAMADNTTLTTTANSSQTEFTVKLTTWVPTPFMTPAQIIAPRSQASGAPTSCAASGWQCQQVTVDATVKLKAGGNNKDQNVETSLMLDVTGSMSGSKFTDMQLAAKDLVDIVVWADQSQVKSRVAIAPFAAAINVGNYTTGDRALLNPNNLRGTVTANSNPALNVLGHDHIRFVNNSGSQQIFRISTHCVSERQGTNRYTDVSPAVAPLGRVYQSGSFYSNTSIPRCDMIEQAPTDPEINLIMPLSSDKVALKNRIDKLRIAGSTAGQLGTAWAWYLLSPNWSSYFPTASAPGPYNDPKVRKIAVLMTDGDYNTQFWNGIWDNASYTRHSQNASPNGGSQAQATALCTAMKAKNIEVFTVGFQVSSNARTFLQSCATTTSHYYDATSGQALRMAFRDIALKISSLILSD